jgi:hypothetical protein
MNSFKFCASVTRGCGVLFFAIALAATSHAQSTFGSIRGTVQDNSGAVIPDAQIILHSVDKNTDRTVKSDGTGSYLFENVLAGSYSLRAQHDGFADAGRCRHRPGSAAR